jgi:hypothetical protein
MTKVRTLFVKSSCQHCRPTLIPVSEINNKMSVGDRVNILDSFAWENFKMANHPILHKIKFEGYPHLLVDGMNVKHFLSKEQVRAFLDGFFEGDKIIGEDGSKWNWKKE